MLFSVLSYLHKGEKLFYCLNTINRDVNTGSSSIASFLGRLKYWRMNASAQFSCLPLWVFTCLPHPNTIHRREKPSARPHTSLYVMGRGPCEQGVHTARGEEGTHCHNSPSPWQKPAPLGTKVDEHSQDEEGLLITSHSCIRNQWRGCRLSELYGEDLPLCQVSCHYCCLQATR